MYTLQQTINWARTFIQYSPLTAGLGGEPAITAANMVITTIDNPPFTWPWNRVENDSILTLSANQQDYPNIALTDFSFLEKVSLATTDGPGSQPGQTPKPYSYELTDVYNNLTAGISQSGMAEPKSVYVLSVNYGQNVTLRFLPVPDQTYKATLIYQKLPVFFTPQASPQSVQTGSGIPTSTVFATGSVLMFSDGINPVNYVSAPGDTLTNLAAFVNLNPNFTASVASNLITITAKSGGSILIFVNTLTDASTGLLFETFVGTGTPSLLTQAWPIPDSYIDIYNNLFLAEAYQSVEDDAEAQRYRMRGIAALLSKAEGLSEMQRKQVLSQYLSRDSQRLSAQLRTQQGSQARGV